MRRIVLMWTIVACAITAGWCQAFYEASGKTAVFSLKAGAKAGSTEIHNAAQTRSSAKTNVRIVTVGDGVLVVLPIADGTADLALYDMRGRLLYHKREVQTARLFLETKTLAMGLYTAIVCLDGKKYIGRIVIAGRRN